MPVAPAYQVIDYYNKDSRTKTYTFTDANGDPINMNGHTLTFTVKKTKLGAVVHTLSTDSEIAISGAGYNVVSIAFDHDFVEERRFYYDLYDNTDDQTRMYGRFNVTIQVNDG